MYIKLLSRQKVTRAQQSLTEAHTCVKFSLSSAIFQLWTTNFADLTFQCCRDSKPSIGPWLGEQEALNVSFNWHHVSAPDPKPEPI